MRISYVLSTVDPIIVSLTSGTTNNHECLDYIPGSAILGALASHHYSNLSPDKSWEVFHSGHCRFSPCYVIKNGMPSLPVPASWHFAKGEQLVDESSRVRDQAVTNHSNDSFERQLEIQYKQWRDGFVNAKGEIAEIIKGTRTKTAIDSSTGAASESQLFSYSYIEAKQTFYGWIDCPDDVFARKLQQSLSRPLRIGRSRNSEFGRVQLNLIDAEIPSVPLNLGNRLVVWCLSDLQLLDKHGMPTLRPCIQDMLPEISGQLCLNKSFIRTNTISRYNQRRMGLDSEQLLISKGSVLVFDIKTPLNDEQLTSLELNGLGINRHQGLGWISVNPKWSELSTICSGESLFNSYTLENLKTCPVSTSVQKSRNKQLIDFITHKAAISGAISNSQEEARRLYWEFVDAYDSARQYNNIARQHSAGPSITQWGRITQAVKDHDKNWEQAVLFDSNAIVNDKNDELGWGICWQDQNSPITFASFTKQKLQGVDSRTLLMLMEIIKEDDLSQSRPLAKQAAKTKHKGGQQ